MSIQIRDVLAIRWTAGDLRTKSKWTAMFKLNKRKENKCQLKLKEKLSIMTNSCKDIEVCFSIGKTNY